MDFVISDTGERVNLLKLISDPNQETLLKLTTKGYQNFKKEMRLLVGQENLTRRAGHSEALTCKSGTFFASSLKFLRSLLL